MELIAFGLNHQTAPLAIREQVAFSDDVLRPALRDLTAQSAVREAAIVSTCNRTEVYCATADPAQVKRWLAQYHALDTDHLTPFLYERPREAAVHHAFRVASGLDSMVLGEPQILGQMKQAVRSAEEAGTLGTVLHKLFQRTFSVAKEVRTRTDIGANAVSLASAGVRVAERIWPSIAQQSVLFVGAGEMIELCAAHFCARQPRQAMFANRTVARGEALAARFGGTAIALTDLPSRIHEHDIVVTCTASSLPIIGKGMVERALKARRHRPMLFVDLAVPRDVELEVAGLRDVFVYTVDDLGKIVQAGVELRASAVDEAETIITRGVHEFMQWLQARDAVPTIRALREHGERVRAQELERAQKALARGDDPAAVIEALSRGLVNKFLHAPTEALQRAPGDERSRLVALISRLYPGARDA
ncbi:MAG: glutamyl-tRNA reductase [Burkholderiales bacterium]|jgi:glutamyl-tRNA reductase|nr:glutamyl-tRNA reductase [Burkholderiales bacterium]